MLLRELVDAWTAVRLTSARGGKIERLAEVLRHTGPAETPAAVAWLAGSSWACGAGRAVARCAGCS